MVAEPKAKVAEVPSFPKRFGAIIFDGCAFGMAYMGLFFVVLVVPGKSELMKWIFPFILGAGVAFLVAFLVRDALFGGRGIGKRFFDLQVIVVRTGKPCGYLRCALRSLLLFVPLEWMLPAFNERGERIADWILDTRVVDTVGIISARQKSLTLLAAVLLFFFVFLPLFLSYAAVSASTTDLETLLQSVEPEQQ